MILVRAPSTLQQAVARPAEWEDVMPIRGMITGEDVVAHAGLIAREFGIGTLWRCCVAIALRRRTTFLACIFPGSPLPPG